MTKLEQLAAMSTVVADTGDIDAIAKLKPVDATTTLTPAQSCRTCALRADVNALKGNANAADDFAVRVGSQIVALVPGVISTEVDARLSLDTQATIAKAEKLIELYDKAGVSSDSAHQDCINLEGIKRPLN